jgi:hypothetical protein
MAQHGPSIVMMDRESSSIESQSRILFSEETIG